MVNHAENEVMISALQKNPARNGGVSYCHYKSWMVKKLL